MKYTVISTDNHINEPPGTYIDRVPNHLKDRAPRLMRTEDGGDGWSFDGKVPRMSYGLGATGAITQQNFDNYKASGYRFEDLLPGNYEGAAAIKDNEVDGVDAAAIYPATVAGAYMVPDRELALACVRAYNDWLIDDFCSVDPSRLLSLPFIPVDDGAEEFVKEAERVVAKGAAGLYLPAPVLPYYDPAYDPLWKVAVEAKVPVTIHRAAVSSRQPRGPEAVTGTSGLSAPMPGLNLVGVIQRFYTAVDVVSNLIFTGLFDRFPSLVFICGEVNGNWIPGLCELMDGEWKRQNRWAHLPFEAAPSSYFGKNVFVTMLDDFVACELAKTHPELASSTTFSSDYPHSVTLWPRSQDFIARMTEGMTPELKHQILAGNAMRAYNLS